MTSEGQHAGRQPAEATSGGGAEQFGTDGFPPDPDGDQPGGPPGTGRPPATGSTVPPAAPPAAYPPPAQRPAASFPPAQPPVSAFPPAQPPTASFPPAQPPTASFPPAQPPASGYPPAQPGAAGFPPAQPPVSGYSPAQPPAAGYSPPQPPPASGYPPPQPPAGSDYPGASASEPNSYAPPPHATPNGGSPFVVPAVPVFGQAPDRPGPDGRPFAEAPPNRYGLPTADAHRDRQTPPAASTPEAHPAGGSDAADGTLPRRGNPLPQRNAAFGAASPFDQVPPPERNAPPSAWAPPPPPPAAGDDPFGRSGESHPYRGGDESQPHRAADVPAGDYHGFAPGSPTRGSAGDDPQDRPGTPADRPPGVSAFGDQRVRVPGATLTGLPDTAPAGNGDALPRRTPDNAGQAPDGGPGSVTPFPAAAAFGEPPVNQEAARERSAVQNAFGRRSPAQRPPATPFSAPASGADSGPSAFGAPASDSESGGMPGSGQPSVGPFGPRPSSATFGQPAADARTGSDASPTSGARSGDDFFGGSGGASPFRQSGPAEGSAGSPFGSAGDFDRSGSGADADQPPFGTSNSAGPFDRPGQGADANQSPFGRSAADQPEFGRPAPDQPEFGRSAPDQPEFGRSAPDQPEFGRPASDQAEFGRPGSGGGASFATDAPFGSPTDDPPAVAEARNDAVPGPRDPAERPAPATGTARPVTASASVPAASRVAPPADGEDAAPPTPAPQARVYGRAAQPQADEEQPAERKIEDVSGAWPWDVKRQRESSAQDEPGQQPEAWSPNADETRPEPRPGRWSPTGESEQRPADAWSPAANDNRAERPSGPWTPGTDDNRAEQPSGPWSPGTDDNRAEQRPGAWSPAGEQDGRPAGSWAAAAPPAQPAAGDWGLARKPNPPAAGAWSPDNDGDGQRAAGAWSPDNDSDGQRAAGAWSPGSDPGGPDSRPGAWAPPGSERGAEGSPFPGRSDEPGGAIPPGPAPQSPARVSGRASASARVSPPAPDGPGGGHGGTPYSEFTTDVAGRSRPPEPYSEHTTDISGRGRSDQPYVPAPALPSMHAAPPRIDGFPPAGQPQTEDDPRMGGAFPGPPNRATVTPPGPSETTSWPAADESDPDDSQGRFDQFKAEIVEVAPGNKPETPHVRMLPVLLGVIIGAALLVGLAFGLVYLISGGDSESGFSVSAGECVKRDGDEAVKASCGDAGAFEVVSVADTKEQCADPGQPYVLNPTTDGRTQVLCLKPRS
ncbi:hypothetical protein [Jidongwangia harbinensis]|uniref:hypothetical protein n=1 Tax=Jidongwangia harbinensis TaxID=2878561 RepID=UPI001CD9C395|nr:hypothetical protein [Jidongwangia harbinensis]MCA2212832.1 hypothetical protein [Jidongwangia harbinensis]